MKNGWFLFSLCFWLVCSSSCTKEIKVASVSLSVTELILNVGETKTLKATVSPSDATNPEITWKSSNLAVARVEGGVVRADGQGSTVISATASNGKFAECKVTVLVPVETIGFEDAIIDIGEGETLAIEVKISPENATDKSVTWQSSDKEIATVDNGAIVANKVGKTIVTATSSNGVSASVEVYVNPVLNGQYYVDLGLSVKWAVLNIGADNRADSGDLYAWGETEPKTNYSVRTYKFYKEVPYGDSYYTKYFRYNSTTRLEAEDDVVSCAWGNGWRMPTPYEYQELANNCDFSWVTIGETKGIMLTSRVEGFTDKSLFLPAGGYAEGTERYGKEDGYYWTSFLGDLYDFDAHYAYFERGAKRFNVVTYRYKGHSVRGVIKVD